MAYESVICLNFEQSQKALLLITISDDKNPISFICLQRPKVSSLIFVIFKGMMIFFKSKHPSKALSTISVTVDGIAIPLNKGHSLKDHHPILVIDGGIAICFILRFL